MAITVQGQTSGDTNATPQSTGASYALIYDPATDGEIDALQIINDSGSASDSIIVKADRWAGATGTPGEAEIVGGESVVIRGRRVAAGTALSGKVWVKTGAASCEVRWMPI